MRSGHPRACDHVRRPEPRVRVNELRSGGKGLPPYVGATPQLCVKILSFFASSRLCEIIPSTLAGFAPSREAKTGRAGSGPGAQRLAADGLHHQSFHAQQVRDHGALPVNANYRGRGAEVLGHAR